MRKLLLLGVCLAVLSGCGAFHNGDSYEAPTYSIQEIEAPSDPFMYAYDLNDSGKVAGIGFSWENGVLTDLDGVGYGINNSGDIVGAEEHSPPEDGTAVILWRDGVKTDLGTMGALAAVGMALNDSDQIAGYLLMAGSISHAFLWDNGEVTDLGTSGVDSFALDINNQGQVVGASNFRACLWENGEMTDLGTLGGVTSEARAINNNGQVVGLSEIEGGEEHGFLWQDGNMVDINSDEGYDFYPIDINDAGQIVGEVSDGGAFLYEGGHVINLQDCIPPGSGWEVRRAVQINESGQIIGLGRMNGLDRVFVLTPVE